MGKRNGVGTGFEPDQSPFIDSNEESFTIDSAMELRSQGSQRSQRSQRSQWRPRRNVSDESYVSARLAANSILQSPSPPSGSHHPHHHQQNWHQENSENCSDSDSENSIVQTPNLNGGSPDTRKTSLRFQLPGGTATTTGMGTSTSSSTTTTSTPPTSASSNGTAHKTGAGAHAKVGSPFMDGNVIMEDEVYESARSPFDDTHENSGQFLVDGKFDNVEFNDKNDGDGMKRHRWGTTRNKKGRPRKESVGRSKTMRRVLNPNKGVLRTMSKKHHQHHHHHHQQHHENSRLDSISKPNTDHSVTYESDSDTEELKDPRDKKEEKRSIVFNKVLPDQFLDPDTGKPNTSYSRNKIRTTKYTPLSFFPKNILYQFVHNVANIYFLVLIILGAFDIFGVPSPVLAAVPLIVIVIITAIKDAIEDSRRTASDMEVNNQITHILGNNSSALHRDYIYFNQNVSDEKVSLWRRFKKMNSRLLFRFIKFCKLNLTKDGKQKKRQLKVQEARNLAALNRKSFDSDAIPSPRPSTNDIDLRSSFHASRKSYTQHEKQLKFSKKYWKEVKVGDILRIYNNDEIPADVIILSTSDEDNCCYVETKNLDGETNLKVRQALKYGSLYNKIERADDMINHQFQIDSEGPHPNLYSYQGNIKYMDEDEDKILQEPITINNLLLRGCSLRNTKWAIGIVVFTGDDTKIMLNAGVTPTKQSRMSSELNYYVLMNFILLFIICFVSGLVNGIYYRKTGTSRDYYEFGTIAGTPFKNGLVDFFVALILYESLVPISLYITIEIIKTAQAFFIYSDIGMYYPRLDYPCTPKSWSISDDLGQIEYVFSDKTGTLTQNLMEFKKCTINGVSYGRAYTEALAGLRKRQGIDVESEAAREKELIAKDKEEMVHTLRSISESGHQYHNDLTFISSDFVHDLQSKRGPKQKRSNEHFMIALALCHSVLAEEDEKNPGKMILKAQSPDEAALVETARSLGFVFKGNTTHGVLVEFHGVTKEYQILNTLEFNSTRKRMSAIVKIPSDEPNGEPKAMLICKGADSIIYDRLSKTQNDRQLLETTSKHLEEFATEGLRTLCIAQREISWSQYTKWNEKHQEAAASLDNREERLEEVADYIEQELILMGGTAIEDRLQDGVPDAIALLGQAGIKLWVLTGDKVETAINIGFSCNLLGNDMELLLLKSKLSDEENQKYQLKEGLSEEETVDNLLSMYLQNHFQMQGTVEEQEEAKSNHTPPNEGFGVVIDGDALKLVLFNPDYKRKFLLLCKQCKAVLCCRVSPAQKAGVVKLVKDTLDVMTLAIGDGSNDVAMIQAANVGVGIAGEEGRQAAMSSDYAIGQFRFLVRLILIHGRWSYKRFSEMIPSFFYKNVIFSVALFWYGLFNDFDGSYLFEFTYLMFYNLAFTSLPVIFLGVLDQDVPAKVSLLVPQLYKTGILRVEFTESKFWWYMIDSLYQSVISFFFPYLAYYKGFQNMKGLVLDHRFWMGIVVTSIACISCNLYILLHQYRWDWWSVLFVALSILVVYAWTGIWTSSMASAEFYKAATQVFGSAMYWTCTFVGVLICLVPRYFYDFVQKIYWPKDVDIIRECVQRGDFDPYPEDYDPTDPDRPKISHYANENVNRMSLTANTPSSFKSNTSTDLEQQNVVLGQSSATSVPVSVDPSVPARDLTPGESLVHRKLAHVNGNRKSVLSMFGRNNVKSFYDNGSFLDAYNTTDDTSLQTEEIAMDDFGPPNHKVLPTKHAK